MGTTSNAAQSALLVPVPEAEALVGALERSRAIFKWKTHGLDAEGLRATVGCSE